MFQPTIGECNPVFDGCYMMNKVVGLQIPISCIKDFEQQLLQCKNCHLKKEFLESRLAIHRAKQNVPRQCPSIYLGWREEVGERLESCAHVSYIGMCRRKGLVFCSSLV